MFKNLSQINWKTNILSFFILALVVGYLQYLLVGIIIQYGFTPDDWGQLLFYKSLEIDHLLKIPYTWSVKGAYTTSQVYFIGILNSFFNFNYQAYQITNIILKTLATLSLYPLILIVFKRKSLAFLTTILYAISYMGSRSLEYVVKGTDYLAIIPMNFFLIVYYYTIKEKLKGVRWRILMAILWFACLMISPIRIYPILILIPLIEVCLWIQARSLKSAISSLKRILILYFPFLLIFIFEPSSILSSRQSILSLNYQALINGNWHLALTPFQGVGLTVLTNDFWGKVINGLDISRFSTYLSFLISTPSVAFVMIILLIAFCKSKKPVKFLLYTYLLSLVLSILFFLIAIHELGIPEYLRMHFDPTRMYHILTSGFMLAISFSSFLEWRGLEKKDNLLLVLWISPPIILLYTFLIWLLAPFGVGFEGQQGYYLVVPAQIASLLMAGFMVIIYDKVLEVRRIFIRFVLINFFIFFLITTYLTNSANINNYYLSAGLNGRYAIYQDKMYNQVLTYLGSSFNYSEPSLFYFDVSGETAQNSYFYEESLFSSLPSRLLIKDGKLNNGCIGTFYRGVDSLAELLSTQDETLGFVYYGQCFRDNMGGNTIGVFYKPDNFYAFKIRNMQLINIKDEVLKKLGFK